ncbi:hypothetical protein M9Y10_004797 [Tritrichomonas musculus]|uniref:Viral A-type inclusion protein n=1 Tax=Tritrichomonas musculus TaxID=1915356 RepID=A0ABR2JJR3_9EUKA
MKAISIGNYVGSMGNAVLEQQNFIKKLLNTLQLIQPQSKEFTNQLNKLKEEYEEAIENQTIAAPENLAEFDSLIPQVQKDLQSIHLQLRVLKSANASSRKGQGQPDLTAIEKNKKLKQSFKEYKLESTNQITEIKSALSELKNELKNSHEVMTSIQANIQASRDELDSFKLRVPSKDDKEEMNTQVNDMQVELEAIKTVLEVMHQGTATTEDLEKMKKSQNRSVVILKNSMQNVRDEIKNIKLLKQGKIPTHIFDLIDSLEQSVNTLQDDMDGMKKDADEKSTVLTKAQQDLQSLMSEMDKLKESSIVDTSSLPINDRMSLIEDRMNVLADHQLKTVNNYNAQRSFLKYLKEDFATEIVERVSQIEKRLDENPIAESNQTLTDQKSLENDEYRHLDQKLEQMIQDLENSNIQSRSVNISGEKPDFPRTVGELRSFQKALRAQAQGDEQSVYQYIEPSNLPLVVQSIDQLLSEMYSEMYQIRDKLASEISELKESSVVETVKCLKHEVATLKRNLNQGNATVSREIELDQQWPVLRSPGKKRAPNPFVEGLKEKIQDLVEDMNNAEDQEDDDINQIKPTMGEAQAKLNNMLTICNNIIDYEEEDQIEQVTPGKMWQTINELQQKVELMNQKENELSIQTRDIQLEESNEMKEAIEELRNTSKCLKYEIKQLKEKTEVQESLNQIDEKMNSLTERINQISGNQSAAQNTINAHSTKLRQQADEIQDKLNHIEELEQTLNDFISNNAEKDHQSIESMKAELEELKDELNNISKAHDEADNTVNGQISEIHQKLKEFEEGAFFRSSSKANPVVQALQKQISDLIQQMEDSQLKDEEDTTGELRPNLSQAQEQLETVQKTLDEILAQENERINMESPTQLVKEVQNLNNRVRMLEGRKPVAYLSSGDLQGRTIEDGDSLIDSFNPQTRDIKLDPSDMENQSEFVYELKNRIEILENTVNRLCKGHQDTTDLINKRHNSLKKIKDAVNNKMTNKLDKMEDDLNHHISDHPISQAVQITAPPDSFIKSKPNPAIELLKQQIEEVIQQIQDEELEKISSSDLNESNGNLKPELNQLKEHLTRLQETLRKIQEQQIYIPTTESLQGITDAITALQEKANNQSNMIRELRSQSDIRNNEKLDQINEEIRSLKSQVKTALQNEENLTNQVQDAILPLSQKIESIERRTGISRNQHLDNENTVLERSISGFNGSSTLSPRKKKQSNMNSIEQLKNSVDALVEKMDDDKLNEEEDTTGELQNNLGQTRKDLNTLQNTITRLLNRANETDFLTNGGVTNLIRDLQQRVSKLEGEGSQHHQPVLTRDIKLDDTYDNEISQLKENVEKLNQENEEIKQIIRSLKQSQNNQTQNDQPTQQKYENIQLSEMVSNEDNNNRNGADDLIRQEISELRNQLNILNDQVNDRENKVDNLQNQLNDLIKGSTSNFFGGKSSKRKRNQAVVEMKDQVDHLLTDMSDPNIQAEAEASEELKPSMDQAQEDLEKLQSTLNNIISQPIADSTILTPEGFLKLIQENQANIQTLAKTEEVANNEIYQLRETIRCLKHEVKKVKENANLEETPTDGFSSWLASSGKPKEPNPAVLAIQDQIDILSKQLDESDLTESDTKERDLNGKVTQTQENLKSLRQALQSILDSDDNDEITPDTLVPTIRELQAKSILMNQEMENAQKSIDSLKSEIKNIKDNEAAQADSFEEKVNENIDAMRTRVEEVSANQIKTQDSCTAQLTKLKEYKSEVDQIRNDLSEVREMLSQAEDWITTTKEEQPKTREISPLVQSLEQQIDKLVQDLNKPDMQAETSNRTDLEERRSRAESQLAKLRESLRNITEVQDQPLTFSPNSIMDAIKDLQAKTRYLETVSDTQNFRTRDIQLQENNEDQINKLNENLEDMNSRIEELTENVSTHLSVVQGLKELSGEDILSRLVKVEHNLNDHISLADNEQVNPAEQVDYSTSNVSGDVINDILKKVKILSDRNEEQTNEILRLKKLTQSLDSTLEISNLSRRVAKLERDRTRTHVTPISRAPDVQERSVNPFIENINGQIDCLVQTLHDPDFQKTDQDGKLQPQITTTENELQLLRRSLDTTQKQKAEQNSVNNLYNAINDLQENALLLEDAFSAIRCMKHEIKKLKGSIQEVDKKLDEHLEENQRIVSELNAPKRRRINPAVEEVKSQIETLKQKMNHPDFSKEEENDDPNSSELSSRKRETQQHLDLLTDTLNKLLEQEEPFNLNMDTLQQMIHDMQAKMALIETQHAESIQNVLKSIKDEETNSSFMNWTPIKQSRKPNPRHEELKNQIDQLVTQMDDPSLVEDDTEGELNPAMGKAKDELQVLRDLLQHFIDADDFNPIQLMGMVQGLETRIQALEEDKQIHVQTRQINLESENKVNGLTQSFDSLKSSLDEFRERLGSAEKNEEDIQKSIEKVNKQIEELESRIHDVESQPSQIFAGFNTFKKRPINPSMEALQQRIDELMKQMNDPELQNEEDASNSKLRPTISKTETELRHLQETLKRLMEQEEPVAITPETLLEMVHQLQAQVTELDVIESHRDTDEKLEETNQNINSMNERIQSISENQIKLTDSFNSFKSRFDQFKEQTSAKENEIDDKIGDMTENINDLQSHVTEIEEHPTQYIAGFNPQQTEARPLHPAIKGIQIRIDELVKEMNDPQLKNEENELSEELQTKMSNTETELIQLKETINRLNEQEEPILVTPDNLLEMVHNLQAKVASLEVSEARRAQNDQNERLAFAHSQNQAKITDSLNNLKSNLDEFRNLLHDTNISEQEMDKNVDDLCQQIEGIQNNIAEYEGEQSPLFTQFSDNHTSKSQNPAIKAVQKRIDELINEMNHPSLQSEDNEANTRLKPSMSKAEQELIGLREKLQKLEEEDLITPYKLYDMVQSVQDRVESVENKVGDHIENHPSEWTVMPREKKASPAVHDLKQLIDELCDQIHEPILDEEDETNPQLKPSIEKAENELKGLQHKVNDLLDQQDKPTVLTPDSLYGTMLDLQSSIAKVRKEQIRQGVQERAIKLEQQNEEASGPNSHKISELENDVESLKSTVAQLRSEMRNVNNLQSPTREYKNLRRDFSSNPPKTEEELASYIERLERVAEGFDRNIIVAQGEIKKVGQIKNQLKEDSDFAKNLQNEIKKQSSAIHCIKHELKSLKLNSSSNPIMSRSINLEAEDDNEKRSNSRLRRRNLSQSNLNDESVQELQDRLSRLENKVDSFKPHYVGFNESGNLSDANKTASIEALSSHINKFVERSIQPQSSDEDVEKLQPDIENAQVQLRELKGKLDDVLNEQAEIERTKITPQRLNEALLDVRQEVEKTQNDINEINDKIETLDENQERTAESFNDFKTDIEKLPKFTQEVLDYINTVPAEFTQIQDEVRGLKEALAERDETISSMKLELAQKIEKVNHELGCVKHEVKNLKSQVPEIKSDIKSVQEDVNNHSNEITNLHDKDSSITQTIEEMKEEHSQAQEKNSQQFNDINDKLSSATTEIEVMKSTNSQVQKQNEQQFNQIREQQNQQFNELKDELSSTKQTIEEMKEENAQVHEKNAIEFQNIKDSLASITQTIEEMKSEFSQAEEQNSQQFNDINDKLSSATTEVEVMKSTNAQVQKQNEQQFNQIREQQTQQYNEVKDELSSIKQTIEEMKQENAQTIEDMKSEYNDKLEKMNQSNEQALKELENKQASLSDQLNENIRTTASSIDKLNSDVSRYHEEADRNTETLNNLVNQRNEDQKKVESMKDDVESLKTNTDKLTEEIANLKAEIKEHEEAAKQQRDNEKAKLTNVINEHSKSIGYTQKVIGKHEKHLKALMEKQKGMEDLIQTTDPVSKDDFQKLEMKYDKLIEQIHSNISVIANGQQSQQESFKKEINNLSQNNSELQSEGSLTGAHHKEGLDDLTKKMAKIFKHVKSQDEKINKLRTDVDGLLNA